MFSMLLEENTQEKRCVPGKERKESSKWYATLEHTIIETQYT